ncbi:hypothetical protein CDV31_004876 [Fusarium ambrosium]|uniref:FAD-binding domain-containing protein n=1 Tax=Fusarium ambrosium TaxID=131363 RepID=A0A428UNA5_9HYPO|nr:hypothetical protein CDV31_004876 [Fusarium ambrosium]
MSEDSRCTKSETGGEGSSGKTMKPSPFDNGINLNQPSSSGEVDGEHEEKGDKRGDKVDEIEFGWDDSSESNMFSEKDGDVTQTECPTSEDPFEVSYNGMKERLERSGNQCLYVDTTSETVVEVPRSNTAVELDIIVVGAGLSGLGAAIASALSGHRVTVYESATELREIGAGLQLTPNSTKILQRWGVAKGLLKVAAEPTSLIVHRYTGKILAQEDDFDKKIRARYSAPFVDVHRVDLQMALYDRAEELGIKFEMGQKVVDVDFGVPEISTASGHKVRADLIVAADGIWSQCRACFTKNSDPPKPTGDLAYRLVIDLHKVTDDDLWLWIRKPKVHFWIGPGAHVVGYSLRGGNQYNIVLLVPDDLPQGVSRQAGSVKEMRELFMNWDPTLNRFLDLVDGVEKWKLMHRSELPSWVNDEGNFVFVGDACHPMLPYLAQGANSAIEDGAVLGLLLGTLSRQEDLPKALMRYQQLRKVRGDSIVKETFKQRDSFHMPDGPEQEARDATFLSQLGKELRAPFPSRWTCPEVQPWLYGYDAFREVEESIKTDPISKGIL